MDIFKRMNAVAVLPQTSQAEAYSDIPTLEQVSEEYAELKRKYEAISGELVEIFQRSSAIGEAMRNGGSDNTQALRPNASRVAGILGGPPPTTPSTSADTLRDLELREQDLKDALRQLTKDMSDLRMTVSAQIREKVSLLHREKVSKICMILRDLYDACADYEDFGDALNVREVAWSALYPMFPAFCKPGDRYSVVAHYLKEAASNGFIPRAQIPREIR